MSVTIHCRHTAGRTGPKADRQLRSTQGWNGDVGLSVMRHAVGIDRDCSHPGSWSHDPWAGEAHVLDRRLGRKRYAGMPRPPDLRSTRWY